MKSPLLSCRGLEAGYGASQVLFGLDFDIQPGEVVALLGRNGMGKSTTVRTIMGLLPARRGRIVLEGRADDLRANEDVREFYLGLDREGGRKSFREVKHYRRRKRWLG